jgi:hypothetical protein
VGLDRELRPNLGLSLGYTFRRNQDREWTPRIGLARDDYTPNPPVTANGLTAQTFSPDSDKVAASGNGTTLTNRPDYQQTYNGVELSPHETALEQMVGPRRRVLHRLARELPGPGAIQNSTHTKTEPLIDCGQVNPDQSGVSARWQVSADALYEMPHGFEVVAGLWARQGYLDPYILSLSAGDDGKLAALWSPKIDDHRLPNLWDLDLRLAKTVKLHGNVALVLSGDIFNVFSSATVLNSNATANSEVLGKINGILNPRMIRFGVRLTF